MKIKREENPEMAKAVPNKRAKRMNLDLAKILKRNKRVYSTKMT